MKRACWVFYYVFNLLHMVLSITILTDLPSEYYKALAWPQREIKKKYLHLYLKAVFTTSNKMLLRVHDTQLFPTFKLICAQDKSINYTESAGRLSTRHYTTP